MTDTMIASFKQQAQSLSYDDTIAFISILLENLKKHEQSQLEKSKPDFLAEVFAIADKEPNLHKSEGKWARDELYRY